MHSVNRPVRERFDAVDAGFSEQAPSRVHSASVRVQRAGHYSCPWTVRISSVVTRMPCLTSTCARRRPRAT